MLEAIGGEALQRLPSFTEQNLANMAWGVAKLAWRTGLAAVSIRGRSHTHIYNIKHEKNNQYLYIDNRYYMIL